MLTDKSCKAAKARAGHSHQTIIIRDSGAHTGLELRCSGRGTATFSLVYRMKGDPVPKRFKIGRYPSISLAKARGMLPGVRAQIVQGLDPAISARTRASDARLSERARKSAAKAAKLEEARKVTVPQLIDSYLSAKGSLRSIRQYQQMLDLNVRRPWARFKVGEIKGTDIDDILDAVASRGNTVQPRRVFEVIRAMLAFANKRGIIEGRPWKQVTFEFHEGGDARSRTLSAAEIRWLWALTENWSSQPNLQRALRLVLLLGQRSNEVCRMQQGEISPDGKTWTIPAARTKNKTTHTVRLPPLARQIIADAIAASPSNLYVFVGARGRPLRSDTLLHRLAEAIDDFNKTKMNPIEPFVVHDLRRTVASGLELLGVPANVISCALNHVSAKKASVTGKHYLHGDLTRSVQAALTEWQGTLEAVLAGGDPLTVRDEDIDAIEARMLARGRRGVAHLRLVS
jgi:integrase